MYEVRAWGGETVTVKAESSDKVKGTGYTRIAENPYQNDKLTGSYKELHSQHKNSGVEYHVHLLRKEKKSRVPYYF